MLTVVVVVFAFCWLPIQIYFLLIKIDRQLMLEFSRNHSSLNSAVYLTCHWLAMANSFVNPIIYCFMNENFWVSPYCFIIIVGFDILIRKVRNVAMVIFVLAHDVSFF